MLDWRDVKGEMRLEMCVFVSSSGLNLFFLACIIYVDLKQDAGGQKL